MKFLRSGNLKKSILFLILILAATLRFYGLNKLRHFTYDQARDALYIKRIIVDHKFRLIGTQSSIPGLYTPPFYYYMMAPSLGAFNFNPIAIDLVIAFLGVLTVGLLYLVLRRLGGSLVVSLATTAIYAFQPAIVSQSRYAWNPNTTPFFVLLAILSLLALLQRKSVAIYSFLFWGSLGMVINLHYSGIVFLLACLLILFFYRREIEVKRIIWGLPILGFEILPIFIFDLRHNFTNSKAVIDYFLHNSRNEVPPPSFFIGLFEKARQLFGLILPINLSSLLSNFLLVLMVMVLALLALKKKDKNLVILLLLLFVSLIFASLYQRGFYFFYLTFLFPLPFLVLGKAISLIKMKKMYLALIFILFFSALNWFKVSFNQVKNDKRDGREQLVKITSFLSKKVIVPFNLVSINNSPDRFGHNAVDYRYFLETFYGKKSLDWDPIDYKKSQNLYLISEMGEIDPLKTGIWEMGQFGPKEIKEKWQVGDTIIYHLVK